jgi:hypothetical protein
MQSRRRRKEENKELEGGRRRCMRWVTSESGRDNKDSGERKRRKR